MRHHTTAHHSRLRKLAARGAAATTAVALLGAALPALAQADTPSVAINGATGQTAWSANAVTVTANATTDTPSDPIYSTTCQVGQNAATTVTGAQQRVQVTGDGAHLVNCYSTSWNGIQSATTFATVQIDSQQPTVTLSGAPASPAWENGTQTVKATANESVDLSGISSVSCTDASGQVTTTAGSVGSIQVTGSQRDTVTCWATSGSGVRGSNTSQSVWVDNTAPTVTYSNVPDPTEWFNTGQPVTITVSKPSYLAPLQALTCDYNGQPVFASGLTQQAPAALHNWSVSVTLPDDNTGQLTCAASDITGNTSAPVTVNQNVDTTAPTGSFVQDPKNPAVILGKVSDNASGVFQAIVQYEQAGHWHNLPTTLNSGMVRAVVPANNTLRHGKHLLRLVVSDNADNSATYTKFANGRTAELDFPTADSLALAYTIHPSGSHSYVRPAANSTGNTSIRLAYGQGAVIDGHLVTRAIGELAHQTLKVDVRLADGRQVFAHINTDKRGAWSYRLPAGADRTVTISYPGSMSIAASKVSINVKTVATISLRINPLKFGLWTLVGAQVNGGGIPHGGLAVMVQWRRNANSPWNYFAHLRPSNGNGLMKVGIPVPDVAAGTRVQIRAYVLPAHGWAYAGANSQIINTVVS